MCTKRGLLRKRLLGQAVALQKMGFGKDKNFINEWRKQERQITVGVKN